MQLIRWSQLQILVVMANNRGIYIIIKCFSNWIFKIYSGPCLNLGYSCCAIQRPFEKSYVDHHYCGNIATYVNPR